MTDSAATPIRTASHPATNEAVFEMVAEILGEVGPDARVLDLGAGRGHLARRVGRRCDESGRKGAERVVAADLDADAFEAREIPFQRIDFNRPLPFADGSFDVVYSVEVAEHLHRPYDVLREVFRVLRPGGRLVLSTPNVLHVGSRLRFFLTGFFDLYQPPSIRPENGGRICGHVMPLHLAYYDYGLRLAGFDDVRYRVDRTKRGSLALWTLFAPVFALARVRFRRAVRKYDPQVAAESRDVVERMSSRAMMTSRSLLFSARRPAAAP
jgi:SAM-dependent methyltransferase